MSDYPNKNGGYQAWITDLQLIATDAPLSCLMVSK